MQRVTWPAQVPAQLAANAVGRAVGLRFGHRPPCEAAHGPPRGIYTRWCLLPPAEAQRLSAQRAESLATHHNRACAVVQ